MWSRFAIRTARHGSASENRGVRSVTVIPEELTPESVGAEPNRRRPAVGHPPLTSHLLRHGAHPPPVPIDHYRPSADRPAPTARSARGGGPILPPADQAA